MSGLKPEIAAIIKQTCIGWEDEKLEKIRQHALHAERLLEERGGKKKGERASADNSDDVQRPAETRYELQRPRTGARERQRTETVSDRSRCLLLLRREGILEVGVPSFDGSSGGWTGKGKGRLTTETFAAETEEGGGSQEQSPRRPRSTNR